MAHKIMRVTYHDNRKNLAFFESISRLEILRTFSKNFSMRDHDMTKELH